MSTLSHEPQPLHPRNSRQIPISLDALLKVAMFCDIPFGVVQEDCGKQFHVGNVVHIPEGAPVQRFTWGIFGALACAQRIALVERGKEAVAEKMRDHLSKAQPAAMLAKYDADLEWIFMNPIMVIDIVLAGRRGKKAAQRMAGCLMLNDACKRRNPGRFRPSIHWTQVDLQEIAARSGDHAATYAHAARMLGRIVHEIWRAVASMHDEMQMKYASEEAWDFTDKRKARALKNFGRRARAMEMWLSANAAVDPFAHDTENLGILLNNIFQEATLGNDASAARTYAGEAISELGRMRSMCEVADVLRVLGTAKDPRVKMMDLPIEAIYWRDVESVVRNAINAWAAKQEDADRLTEALTELRNSRDPEAWYTFIKERVLPLF